MSKISGRNFVGIFETGEHEPCCRQVDVGATWPLFSKRPSVVVQLMAVRQMDDVLAETTLMLPWDHDTIGNHCPKTAEPGADSLAKSLF